MLSQLRNMATAQTAPVDGGDYEDVMKGVPVLTKYECADVAIPPSFLADETPRDAQGPMTAREIDWAATALPENKGGLAVVLDNVLSASECDELLRLTEQSVPQQQQRQRPVWRPALVNIGGGYEVLAKDYRNSDRIIWDQQDVVDRLWRRCLYALRAAPEPGLAGRFAVLEDDKLVSGSSAPRTERWSSACSTGACAS